MDHIFHFKIFKLQIIKKKYDVLCYVQRLQKNVGSQNAINQVHTHNQENSLNQFK